MTRSASRSTSLSTCELTITVRPSAPSWRNRAISCTRCTGSAPFSGSSSTSTAGPVHQRGGDLGALAHALAEAVDAPVGDVEQADRCQRGIGRAAVGDTVEVWRRSARTGAPSAMAGTASSSGTRAMCRWTPRSRRGSRPSTRTAPWLTPSIPVIARISVVLPAPFGPSSPVTPGPNEQLNSDSATFGPNHTDTSLISTVGSASERRVLTHPSGGCARAPSPPGSLALAPSGCPRCARSSFDPPIPPQQHADASQQHDDVRADRQRTSVLDAGERRVGVDVAEEDEIAEVQREGEHVDDRGR